MKNRRGCRGLHRLKISELENRNRELRKEIHLLKTSKFNRQEMEALAERMRTGWGKLKEVEYLKARNQTIDIITALLNIGENILDIKCFLREVIDEA